MKRKGWSVMELFKTTGILDETVLKEVAKKGIPKSGKKAAILYFVLCIVFSAARYPALAVVFFSTGLFLVIWQIVVYKRITVKKNLSNMQEFNGVTGYQYTTWFDDEGIVVWNLTNHAEGKFRYAFISRIFETEHILALQVKSRQFVPIFKSGLGPEEIDRLTAFLKTKNKKIKIDRLKKRNNKGTRKSKKG